MQFHEESKQGVRVIVESMIRGLPDELHLVVFCE